MTLAVALLPPPAPDKNVIFWRKRLISLHLDKLPFWQGWVRFASWRFRRPPHGPQSRARATAIFLTNPVPIVKRKISRFILRGDALIPVPKPSSLSTTARAPPTYYPVWRVTLMTTCWWRTRRGRSPSRRRALTCPSRSHSHWPE